MMVTGCIRPEQVTLSTGPAPEGSSARNAFPGTITNIVPMGPFYRIFLDCGFFVTAFVTAPSMENLALETGKAVMVSFKATSVHLLQTRKPSDACP
jgi:tungstate transport system ATP-binding protein